MELDDDSFKDFLSKEGVHFVKFYAPWCGHCQKLALVWEELAGYYKENSLVHIIKVCADGVPWSQCDPVLVV